MQNLNVDGFTEEEIIKALHSNRVIKWEYMLLDKLNKKIGAVDVTDCSYSFDADAEIKGSARFTINENGYRNINFLSERIKPIFCLKMGDKWVKWEQGIYLLNSPNRIEKDGNIYRNIEAYDLSVILSEDRIDNRYFIPKGTQYITVIRDLIVSTGITDISVQDSVLELSIDKEYEIGTSKLEIINDLLLSINYNSVWFNKKGTCMLTKYVNGRSREYEYTYRTDHNSVLYYGAEETIDLFNIPNKFVRYVENPETDYLISTFINDNSSNKLSTTSRGRTITDIQSITDIADQETLDLYVRKVAEQASIVYGGIKFNTAIMPHHSFNDCLLIKNDTLGITEKVIETAWSIDASGNGTMSHNCRKVIELW